MIEDTYLTFRPRSNIICWPYSSWLIHCMYTKKNYFHLLLRPGFLLSQFFNPFQCSFISLFQFWTFLAANIKKKIIKFQGADTIVKLIKNAGFLIPEEKREKTPLIVRATAGLRLLPAEKANQLISHVEDAISK